MKLKYKGKKWDKEATNIQKLKKVIGGRFDNNEKYTIEKFTGTGHKDFLRLYDRLSVDYQCIAEYYYLDNINSKEVIKYTYFSGYAMVIAKYLYEKGMRTEYNEIVENSIKYNMDFALYQLIATEETEAPFVENEKDNLIMLMYQKKYEQVKQLLGELPDNPDESKEIYYVKPVFLKNIYMAIIEHDEKKFNEELAKRIKKYRKNMVGYSTIVDVVSVALIKMAEREGIQCTVDVIEIPKQFWDRECKINKEEHILPFYDDFLKLKLD